MPKVRASSGRIGTTNGPKLFSRMRSLRMRTKAIVEAIFWWPEPFLIDL